MSRAITEHEAELTALGICLSCSAFCDAGDPHAPDCDLATGLGTARGDVTVPGEVCGGPCRQPLIVGERYQHRNDGTWCVGCATTTGEDA